MVFNGVVKQMHDRHQTTHTQKDNVSDRVDSEKPEPIIKRRRLRFVAADAKTIRDACGVLIETEGVKAAMPERDALVVEYDLRQITLAKLELTCSGVGLVLSGGLHGLRRTLWRFKEENEIEYINHPASGSCCNRPPRPK